jgi:hypothetical protein
MHPSYVVSNYLPTQLIYVMITSVLSQGISLDKDSIFILLFIIALNWDRDIVVSFPHVNRIDSFLKNVYNKFFKNWPLKKNDLYKFRSNMVLNILSQSLFTCHVDADNVNKNIISVCRCE